MFHDLGRRFLGTLSLFFLFIHTSEASDFWSPRTAALGGAGHAAPLLTDSIYLNPSYVSFTPTHALSFSYLTYSGPVVNSPQGPVDFYGRNWNASVIDGSRDSIFQAGVGYTRRNDASFLTVGASKNIIKELGVGIGAKFIFPNDSSGNRISEGTFSTTGIISRWFQSSFIIDNLFQSATYLGLYREYIIGTKFNIDSIFFIYIDPHWVPTLPDGQSKFGYESGAEFPFFSDFFLRLGLFKNSMIPYEAQRGDGFGIGAGWLGPKMSLEYSFNRAWRPIDAHAHNFGISLYF
jgi:hypothetical protein